MLLTGGFEAHFALPVEPCVPVPGVHLQDRLEFSTATIDAALHERHGASPLFRCRFLPVRSQLHASACRLCYQLASLVLDLALDVSHSAARLHDSGLSG